MNDLPAFGRVNLIDLTNNFKGLFLTQYGLLGIDLSDAFDFFSGKELLRFRAGHSPRAMVGPVHFVHVLFS